MGAKADEGEAPVPALAFPKMKTCKRDDINSCMHNRMMTDR